MRIGCHLIVKSLSRRTELTSITLLDRKRILRNFATGSTFTIRNLKFEEEVEEVIETEENQNDAARPFKELRLALVASFARLSIRDWSFRLAQKLEAEAF